MTKVNIIVNDSKTSKEKSHPVSSSATHRVLQRSTTLSRRYVKKPVSKIKISSPEDDAKKIKKATPKKASKSTPRKVKVVEVSVSDAKKQQKLAMKKAMAEKAALRTLEKKRHLEELKALKAKKLAEEKALAEKRQLEKRLAREEMARKKLEQKRLAQKKAEPKKNVESQPSLAKTIETPNKSFKKKHRGRRILLAFFCSAVTVGALALFVHFNMPDISVKVAAMQTGIEASYPTFIPRGFSLSSVTSEKDGIVLMYFTNSEGVSFTLSEEKSTWDSTALLNNYVKKNFPSDYSTIREQGITVYVRGENAAWVNGGILYKIDCSGGALTKEQVRNIATSM